MSFPCGDLEVAAQEGWPGAAVGSVQPLKQRHFSAWDSAESPGASRRLLGEDSHFLYRSRGILRNDVTNI